MIYKFIPRRFLEDKDGYPTELAWRIHYISVKLGLQKPVSISTKPIKIMWGDDEITNIEELTVYNGCEECEHQIINCMNHTHCSSLGYELICGCKVCGGTGKPKNDKN